MSDNILQREAIVELIRDQGCDVLADYLTRNGLHEARDLFNSVLWAMTLPVKPEVEMDGDATEFLFGGWRAMYALRRE